MKTLILIFGLIAACPPDSDPAGTRSTVPPPYEGDRIAATFPARQSVLTSKQMFDQVVAPLMRRQGLGALVGAMSVPSTGYVYQQRVSGIPVEHAIVIATSNSVQGTVFARYRVTNKASLSPSAATPRDRTAARADLVLYPAGNTSDGHIELRYAYRMLLADRDDPGRTWMAWIDADSGKMLNLAAQFTEE